MDNIKEIQKELLSIMIDVDVALNKIGIKYSLAGGSLLGAFRHGGFIPWDDDIDIEIDYKDHDKFINMIENALPKKYKLICSENTKGFPFAFMKIVNTEVPVFVKHDYTNGNSNFLWIDIFQTKPTKRKKRSIWFFILLNLKFAKNTSYSNRLKNWSKILLYIFPIQLLDFFIKTHMKLRGKDDSVYNEHTFPHTMKCLKSANVNSMIFYEFEELKLPGYADAHGYLSHYYGDDYMTLPPEEKRHTHEIEMIK